ncbi:hypothetical protein SEA_BIG4_194 [Microbacterium phage Big4]|nr:hypothetical protein SEA_BIG4_194 [Microbacterium phage Big4]
MTSNIAKLFHEYTEDEMDRGRELFLEKFENKDEGLAVWDRMNGGRIVYYWDAHVERLDSEFHDHGGWEDH